MAKIIRKMAKKTKISTESLSSSGNSPFEALAALRASLPEGDVLSDSTPENESIGSRELLHVVLERKGRNGKPVSIVSNWSSIEVAEAHQTEIKKFCGVGGSLKNGELILQGNQLEALKNYAANQGWKVKKTGG